MVVLLRYMCISNAQVRLFALRGCHQDWNIYVSSSFPTSTSTLRSISFPCLSSGVSIRYFSANRFLFAHVQDSKRIERHIDFPIWIINPKKIETPIPEVNNTTSSNPSVQPTSEEPNKNNIEKKITKPSLWVRIKKEIVHYYHGIRLLVLEVGIASGICFRVLGGHTLTRRERKQLVRTLADILRLVPFAVFIIVPFMELLLPFYLKFFPFMLPSTFKDKSAEANAIQQRLKAKLELTHFLQETLLQTTGAIKSDSDTPTVDEFQEFIKKVQKSGEQAQAKDITRFSKLFEDQVTLDSLDNKQLRMLCQLLSLPTIGPSHLLRFQIWMRVRQLKAEDKLIASEGVDHIPPWELQSLCQERGMRSVGLPKEKLQSQLSEWLNLHLEQNVPITLLLFSRALHVTQALVDQNPLQQAIAQLPPSASSEAVARVLETTPHGELDPVTKIKVLREEQDSIKAERVQRKQEFVEKQKAEQVKTATTGLPEDDQAPLLKGLKNEELDKFTPGLTDSATSMSETTGIQLQMSKPAPNVQPVAMKEELVTGRLKGDADITPSFVDFEKPKTPDTEEITEISAGDLAEIRSAIAESTPELRDETIHELKEQVAETAKLQRQAELVAAEQVSDKRKSKAALRLGSRVDRLIKEMDMMVDNLNDKRVQLLKNIEDREIHIQESTEAKERSKIMDEIKADQDLMVDIKDLLISLKRIRNVPDNTKWEKILKVLDEDHDGKIEMKHLLSVIELLGTENVKLSSKEIARILEMFDNEEMAKSIPTDELKVDKNRLKPPVDHSS
ncbi:Mitochondrial proton/calcium exchanger protein [Schistosoma japonicum]|nr:Mitochondrial proton/calcium exchanger protein [Schistosoma japonicum]KAH8859831.1 Mitochondrial proton/calcium exchanger protein [Schistosoma japonicum]